MNDPLKSQNLASDPNISVWVMASAGSGKTKVLTDRILRLLLSNVEPHKILCLTYTKVASIEMQKRLYHELQKWVICSDYELENIITTLTGKIPHRSLIMLARGLLAKILDSQYKIKIQTIHSFCMGILQSFPFEAKIPINFEMIDDNRNKILLKNCQNQILTSAPQDDFLLNILLKINSQTSESTLNDLVSQLLAKKDRIYRLKKEFQNIENLANQIYKKFNIESEFCKNFEKNIFENFIQNINLDGLQNFINNASKNGKNDSKYCQSIQAFLNNPSLENFSYLKNGFYTQKYTTRKFNKKTEDFYDSEIKNYQQKIDDFNQQFIAHQTIENSINLISIVDKILEEFHRCKFSNGFLDYGDLINITNQLLQDPKNCEWIKLKMDCSFDHLLVDEAQDTSPLQWSIIKALVDDFFSGESRSLMPRSIFIVGDEKQSIMGFQGADINETKNFYEFLRQKSANNLKNIEMSVSFRSGQKILQLVDAVFHQENFQNSICKIGKYSSHISHRKTVGYAELWQFEAFENQNNEKNLTIFDHLLDQKNQNENKDILAKFIANKIKNWFENKKNICDKNRPIEYGDIMILVRNRKNGLIEKLANNLSQLDIPYVSVGKIKFSENLLLQDFLSLARFAILPADCYNLACLLKSPFFNLDESKLFDFCNQKNQQNCNLWNIVQFSELGYSLKNIIRISKSNNCFEFFFSILNDPINRENIFTRFGFEAEEIINNFLFICQNFCTSTSTNLQNFIEFVEKIDPEIAISSNQPNRVKITTIHSSKGLQAPIVILADTLYNYSKQTDNREKIIWDHDFPLWILKDSKINYKIKEIFDQKISQNYEEHLRLLYVALTRAEDEIYISGLSQDFDEKCWFNIINKFENNLINKVIIKNEVLDLGENNFSNKFDFKLSNFNYFNNNYEEKFQVINQALSFGEILHKALEIIGKNHFRSNNFLLNYLKKYFTNHLAISNENLLEILDICQKYLNSEIFKHIFKNEDSSKIFCEYEVNFDQANLRIDLLKITDSEILIIDYKSDDNPPNEVPKQYLNQLENYKKAIQKIYINHKIEAKILWIKSLKFSKI